MVHHLAKSDCIWFGRSSGTRLSIWGSSVVLREHSAAAVAWRREGGLGIGEDVEEVCVFIGRVVLVGE
jgi:hypothetical protein